MSSHPHEIHQITGARRSLSEDVRSRQSRYLVSMGVRTACFVLAVATTGPLRWVFFVGAVILPYLAVVIANGGREPAQPVPTIAPPERVALEAPPVARTVLRYDDGLPPA